MGKYIQISPKTQLSELIDTVGSRNVDNILHVNSLERIPDVGTQLAEKQGNVVLNSEDVDWQRKSTLLNKLAGDLDLFEMAASMGSSGWKLLSSQDTFAGMLKIPDNIRVSPSTNVYGSGVHVPKYTYSKAMQQLASEKTNHTIDLSIFNEYSTIRPSNIIEPSAGANSDPFQWFHIPWGEVTLYSNLSGQSQDFPVYPEELQDGVRANYTSMPDIIYQYEPWQLYQSSGPRQNQYTFHFHRDMWTGDHEDGCANKLIRFCQASCYASYKGSAVYTDLVTLYIHGTPLITGVMTETQIEWSGPIGHDGWYLECKLTLNIIEVSKIPLNYSSVKAKPLIG